MDLSFANLAALLRQSVTKPGQAAAMVLRLDLPKWASFATVVVAAALSAVVLWATYSLFPMEMEDGTVIAPVGPLIWAVMVSAGVFILTGLIFVIGRIAGGKARFIPLLVLMAWFQIVQLVMYGAQLLLLVALPPLGVLATLVSLGLTVWILGHFIRVAHGFAHVAGPILGIVGGAVLMFLLLLGSGA